MSKVRNDDFEDDPVLVELRRIREAQSAVYGHSIERRVADSRRMQFLFGADIFGRGPSGELEVIHKGTGKLNFDVLRVVPASDSVGVPSDG